MPGSRTHDIITVVSAAALVPPVYAAYATADPVGAPGLTAVLVGAHLLSGVMFSPDLDLDSAIDDRWGLFFWIWRPYMWLIPHRRFWSHSLVVSPILRLLYFYLVLVGSFLLAAWAFGRIGITLPDYHVRLTNAMFATFRTHPIAVQAFMAGFITGSAAHTIADWLVTGGKNYLRYLGIRVRRDYANHDRWVPREHRGGRRARSWDARW